MASVEFDKKQLPQIIGLGVLSLGAFAFFALRIFVPPAGQAAPPSTPSAASAAKSATLGGAGSAGANSAASTDNTPDASTLIGAAAPTDAMRDPFIALTPMASNAPTVTPPPASANPLAPSTSSIPGLNQIKPLPLPGSGSLPSMGSLPGVAAAPPVPESWQLTGIIQSDTDPSNALAIIRDSTNHRYLRLGDQLDEHTKLVGIDKDSITLVRNGQRVQLNVSASISEGNSTTVVNAPVAKPAAPSTQAAPNNGSPFPGLSVHSALPKTKSYAPTPQQHVASATSSHTYVHGAAD